MGKIWGKILLLAGGDFLSTPFDQMTDSSSEKQLLTHVLKDRSRKNIKTEKTSRPLNKHEKNQIFYSKVVLLNEE
jgi:hypothetical protein